MARTKGSKNGISRTKGYTAVGQRAKGRWINGRYVYDYGAQNNWQQMAAKSAAAGERNNRANNNASYAKKVNDAEKKASIKAASEKGSKNNWQTIGNARRSNAELYTDVAAGKKSSAYVPTYSAGIRYFRGNPKISTSEKGKNFVEVNDDAYAPNYKKELRNKAIAAVAAKGDAAKALDAQRKAEAKARWQAGNKAMAANKAKEQGTKNNWQQQAALEQWKQQNRNNISAKKKAEATKGTVANASKAGKNNNWQDKAESSRQKSELYNKMVEGRTKGITGVNGRTGDTEVHTIGVNPKNNKLYFNSAKVTKKGAGTIGAQNNWQQRAAREAAGTESKNKVTNGSARATYMPRRRGGDAYVNPNNLEIDTTRKPNKTKGANAMRNDPRYSTGLGTVNFMTSSQRDKYDYSGKRDDRAPTFYALGKKPEKMDRTPYWDHMANATNKQELAKAQAKSKEFMNDFRKSKIRNSRSDIGNALADAKEDARKAWKKLFSKKKKKK